MTRRSIMKQFACGSVVPGCDGVVLGETVEDVMAAAAAHAADVHGMDSVPDDVVAAIQAGITDV